MTSDSQAGAESATLQILQSAVEAFRKREIGYRDILEDLPAAIYTIDAEGKLTYFNKACVEFSGRVPTVGSDSWCVSWRMYTPTGDHLPHDQCPMAVALRERRPVRGVEAVAERPDGTRIAFLPYPTPIIDEAGNLLGAVNMLVDISEQKRTQQRIETMAREVDHRANNLLAVMQALMHLTTADDLESYRAILSERFASLARTNSLVAKQRWVDIDLGVLVEEEVAAFSIGNVRIDGPPIPLAPGTAQCFGMIMHELCTNAVKYGALSVAEGRVELSWGVDDEGSLMLRWRESGGPPVSEPARKGTGTSVIDHSARRIGGKLFRDWSPGGFSCTLICNVADL